MSLKYSFQLERSDGRPGLPHKLILAQEPPETAAHVLLRLLAYLLFFRERLQIEARLHDDHNPFRPDLVQLDYSLRPALWIECGDCPVDRLDRLAVKVPDAEIWVVRRSADAAAALCRDMARRELRRQRYRVLGFDAAMFDEVLGLLQPRNRLFWVEGAFDPPLVQFDFNGLWFDAAFTVLGF